MMKIEPFFISKIWGGSFLPKVKGKRMDDPIGELLEVSRLKGMNSTYQDTPLEEVFSEEEIPYLIKFIETTENLSIQVHPDDEYAKKVENSSGKTECWLILDAGPESGVYLGLKPGTTKERFADVVENKGEVHNLLNFYPVKAGDFLFVPPGSIHAIGEGIVLLEVQQSSGITYRVWDWNRVGLNGKPRNLHVEKAFDVINFSEHQNTPNFFQFTNDLFNKDIDSKLVEHADFSFSIYRGNTNEEIEVPINANGRTTSLIGIKGITSVSRDNKKLKLGQYSTVLCPQNFNSTIKMKFLSDSAVVAVID